MGSGEKAAGYHLIEYSVKGVKPKESGGAAGRCEEGPEALQRQAA